MQKPHVKNTELKRHIERIYRPDATIGSGSTAAAIRFEAITGKPVKGSMHLKKGKDEAACLERWLRNNSNAASCDIAVAENVLKDLKDAIGEACKK